MSDAKNRPDEREREEANAQEEDAPADAAPPASDGERSETPESAPPIELNPIAMLIEEQNKNAALQEALAKAEQEKERAMKAADEAQLRAVAELANKRKQMQRNFEKRLETDKNELLTKVFQVFDDFERASANLPPTIEQDPWVVGVSMILPKFKHLLDDYGVEAIDPTGDPFDPNLHQAIGAEESDEVESGHVIETLQKGYRAGDSVLRPALVKVAN